MGVLEYCSTLSEPHCKDGFLVAAKRLYKRVCPSVGPSVRPSVANAFVKTLKICVTAPAQQPRLMPGVYPALFQWWRRRRAKKLQKQKKNFGKKTFAETRRP